MVYKYINYFISLTLPASKLNILILLIRPQDVSAGKSSLFYILPIDIRRILMHFQVRKPSPLVISDRNKNALLPLLVVVSQKIGPSQGLQVNYGVLATDSAPDR